MSGELVEDSVTEKNSATAEKILVVQQEMYKVLNINKKGINAGRGPGADAFCCCVCLGGRGGMLQIGFNLPFSLCRRDLDEKLFSVISHFQNLM